MNITKLIFLFIIMVGLSACDKQQQPNSLDEIIDQGTPYFSIAYTPAFAKRFSLMETQVQQLDKSLHAVAVEINRINNRYSCDLHFYVDDKLDIYSPVPGEYFSDKATAEFVFVNQYNETDQASNSSALNNNLMRVLFRSASLDHADHGIASTLEYRRIHWSFLPGISLISIDLACVNLESENHPADIWIQKRGVGNYLIGNEDPKSLKDSGKSYRFRIPDGLIVDIQPYVEIAVEHNLQHIQ